VTYRSMPPLPTYGKAERRDLWRRLARLVTRDQEDLLLSLEEVQDRLHLFEQSYGGIRPIRVDQIVGSAARTSDFDREWTPLKPHIKRRWEQLENAFPNSDFPPIVVYQIDEAFFVVDGHHRVAIAKARSLEFIDAEITQIHSNVPIGPNVDTAELIHLEMRQAFLRQSGLGRVRPDAAIHFTRPVGYAELLEHVRIHGYHLMQARGTVPAPAAIAADWYDGTYLPTVTAIRESGLLEDMPGSTETDLFLWLHQRRRATFSVRGTIPYDDVIREAVDDTAQKRKKGR